MNRLPAVLLGLILTQPAAAVAAGWTPSGPDTLVSDDVFAKDQVLVIWIVTVKGKQDFTVEGTKYTAEKRDQMINHTVTKAGKITIKGPGFTTYYNSTFKQLDFGRTEKGDADLRLTVVPK